MRTLIAEPLTAEDFAPFGDVIEATASAQQLAINHGNTTRFHDLAALDLMAADGRAGISIFRSRPLTRPITAKLMEYHPKSSQAFMPLSDNPYLVVVAPRGDFDAAQMRAFVANGTQGVNYHAGTWHHFSLALGGESDFLVVDRIADDDNCVEYSLREEEQVEIVF
jgi:ureidoglycolate lyase